MALANRMHREPCPLSHALCTGSLIRFFSRCFYVMNFNPLTEWTMRKTSDLVQEMKNEAKTAFLVAIAVGFETETKFVFSSGSRPLEDLNRLVQSGGSPIGLLRFEKEDSSVQGFYRPFEEYANEPWVQEYLGGLLENTGEIIAMSQMPGVPDY